MPGDMERLLKLLELNDYQVLDELSLLMRREGDYRRVGDVVRKLTGDRTVARLGWIQLPKEEQIFKVSDMTRIENALGTFLISTFPKIMCPIQIGRSLFLGDTHFRCKYGDESFCPLAGYPKENQINATTIWIYPYKIKEMKIVSWLIRDTNRRVRMTIPDFMRTLAFNFET